MYGNGRFMRRHRARQSVLTSFPLSLLITILTTGGTILQAQTRILTIDAGTVLSPIELLIGTNAGPMAMGGSGAEYSDLYRELGFSAIRTHDYYGPCDWMTIFPDWNADPSLESSYNFASTDSVVRTIVAEGFSLLFRLGSSWRGNRPEYTNDPPGTLRDTQGQVIHAADTNDFRKFAEICRHIVMHYNEGWANGHRFGIKRWEIWNEPSLRDQFWTGTAIQFHRMFVILLKALKSHDSTLLVGGPGQAGQTTEGYYQKLIEYCAHQGAPLDFYSWHSYGGIREKSTPWDIGRKAIEASSVLQANGYAFAKQYCDEWNAGLNAGNFADSGRGAAFYAAALTYLVENGVAETYQYRGDNHGLGLVSPGGRVKIAAQAFRAWRMLTAASQRLRSIGTDTTGFTLIATRTDDGSSIRALLANFPDTPAPVDLRLLNLGSGGKTELILTRRVIDDTRRLALLDSTILTGNDTLRLSFSVASRSVQYLELTGRIPSTTGRLSEPESSIQVTLFPNPVSSRAPGVTVRVTNTGETTGSGLIGLHDLLGRRIGQEYRMNVADGCSLIVPDLPDLRPGSYIFSLRYGGESVFRKLIVTD